MRGRGKGKKKGREKEEDPPEARGSGRKSPTAPSAEVVPTKPKEMTAPQMAAVVVVVVVVVWQVTGNAMFPFWVSDIPITYGYCGKPCPRFAR